MVSLTTQPVPAWVPLARIEQELTERLGGLASLEFVQAKRALIDDGIGPLEVHQVLVALRKKYTTEVEAIAETFEVEPAVLTMAPGRRDLEVLHRWHVALEALCEYTWRDVRERCRG